MTCSLRRGWYVTEPEFKGPFVQLQTQVLGRWSLCLPRAALCHLFPYPESSFMWGPLPGPSALCMPLFFCPWLIRCSLLMNFTVKSVTGVTGTLAWLCRRALVSCPVNAHLRIFFPSLSQRAGGGERETSM